MNFNIVYKVKRITPFSSRGFATDGAARAEIKLAYSLPSRDGGRQLVNPRVT